MADKAEVITAGIKQNKIMSELGNIKKKLYKGRYLYLLLLPVLAHYILFQYVPMYGLILAFKRYVPALGIWGSPWVGTKYITDFFQSIYIGRLLRNTVVINLYYLAVCFPAPIILALMINEVRHNLFKRTVQTIVYLPNFLSTVVICGMIVQFLSPSDGIVNMLIKAFGLQPIHFLARPEWFQTIYVFSGLWQGVGWNSIVYIAALASIDQNLYEAATVDGASSWQKLWNVTIPGIVPTIVILLILNIGNIFTIGFDKIILLYNPNTYDTADVISTYIYRRGILGGEVSYATAIGLFNQVINFIMLLVFNKISKKVTDTSLW